jgi:hypothetical protein
MVSGATNGSEVEPAAQQRAVETVLYDRVAVQWGLFVFIAAILAVVLWLDRELFWPTVFVEAFVGVQLAVAHVRVVDMGGGRGELRNSSTFGFPAAAYELDGADTAVADTQVPGSRLIVIKNRYGRVRKVTTTDSERLVAAIKRVAGTT